MNYLQLLVMIVEFLLVVGLGYVPFIDNFGTFKPLLSETLDAHVYDSSPRRIPDGLTRGHILLPDHKFD